MSGYERTTDEQFRRLMTRILLRVTDGEGGPYDLVDVTEGGVFTTLTFVVHPPLQFIEGRIARKVVTFDLRISAEVEDIETP